MPAVPPDPAAPDVVELIAGDLDRRIAKDEFAATDAIRPRAVAHQYGVSSRVGETTVRTMVADGRLMLGPGGYAFPPSFEQWAESVFLPRDLNGVRRFPVPQQPLSIDAVERAIHRMATSGVKRFTPRDVAIECQVPFSAVDHYLQELLERADAPITKDAGRGKVYAIGDVPGIRLPLADQLCNDIYRAIHTGELGVGKTYGRDDVGNAFGVMSSQTLNLVGSTLEANGVIIKTPGNRWTITATPPTDWFLDSGPIYERTDTIPAYSPVPRWTELT